MNIGVILAKGKSTGVPGKNMRPIAGKPLIGWTLAEAVKVPELALLVVASDDLDILRYAETYRNDDLEIITLAEPKQVAAASSAAALRWVVFQLNTCGVQTNNRDVLVEMMPTNPLKTAADVSACIRLMKQKHAQSVIAVTHLDGHHPARAKRIEGGRIMDWCEHCEETSSQRQELTPPAYIRASAIYCMTIGALFARGRFGHEDSYAYILPQERGVGIDNGAEFAVAEYYLRSRHEDMDKLYHTAPGA